MSKTHLYSMIADPKSEFGRAGRSMTVTMDAPEYNQKDLIETIKARLRKSPTGNALLKHAEKSGVKFIIDIQTQALGYYQPNKKIIAFNPMLLQNHEGAMVSTLAHEMRHHFQATMGINPFWGMSPRDNVHILRTMESDADTAAAIVAQELDNIGEPDIKEGIRKAGRGYMIDAMEKSLKENAGNWQNGKAARAAFDSWTSNKRLMDAYDMQILQFMLVTSNNFIAHLKKYNKFENGIAQFKPMRKTFLEKMGELPCITANYLKGTSNQDIMAYRYRGIQTHEGSKDMTIKTVFLELIERRLGIWNKTKNRPMDMDNDNVDPRKQVPQSGKNRVGPRSPYHIPWRG